MAGWRGGTFGNAERDDNAKRCAGPRIYVCEPSRDQAVARHDQELPRGHHNLHLPTPQPSALVPPLSYLGHQRMAHRTTHPQSAAQITEHPSFGTRNCD